MPSGKQRLLRTPTGELNVFWIPNGFQLKLKKFLKWFLEVAKEVSPAQPSTITTQLDVLTSSLQMATPNTEVKSSIQKVSWICSHFFFFFISLDILITGHNKKSNFPFWSFFAFTTRPASPMPGLSSGPLYRLLFAKNCQFSVSGELYPRGEKISKTGETFN